MGIPTGKKDTFPTVGMLKLGNELTQKCGRETP